MFNQPPSLGWSYAWSKVIYAFRRSAELTPNWTDKWKMIKTIIRIQSFFMLNITWLCFISRIILINYDYIIDQLYIRSSSQKMSGFAVRSVDHVCLSGFQHYGPGIDIGHDEDFDFINQNQIFSAATCFQKICNWKTMNKYL